MTPPPFIFNHKTGELSREGKMIALGKLHAQIFDCYYMAQAPVTVLSIAASIGYPRHIIDNEIPKLLARLRPLRITLARDSARGVRSIVCEPMPKWAPKIAPPVRLEGEVQ